MRRVVVTGIGIISSIGNNQNEVLDSLKSGKSGIVSAPEYIEKGFRSQVHGIPNIVLEDHIDKRQMRFMGPGAAFNYLSMEQAIQDSGLEENDVSNERTGLIVGSGGPSTSNLLKGPSNSNRERCAKKNGAFYGNSLHVFNKLSLPCDPIQNQRSKLFNNFCLFHLGTLYWQWC